MGSPAGGSSKGSGGFMPNPVTGAPRNATPGLPSPGKSAGSSMPNPGGADATNAINQGASQQMGQMVSPPGPMNPGGGGGRPGWGAPISDNFSSPDQANLSPTLKMQGDILKRWDGTSGNVPNPYRNPITTTQAYTPGSPVTPSGVPPATPLGPQTRPTGGANVPGAAPGAPPAAQPQAMSGADFQRLQASGGPANTAMMQQMADKYYGGNLDAVRSAFNTSSYGAGGQAVQHQNEDRPWLQQRLDQLRAQGKL